LIRKIILVVAAVALITSGCGLSRQAHDISSTSNTDNNVASDTGKGSTLKIVNAEGVSGQTNLTEFVQSAKKHPKDAKAQFMAAKSEFANGSSSLAVTYYKKAIQLDPKYVDAYNNLGNVYLRSMNDPNHALPYYQEATKLDPTYGFAWLGFAQSQQALNQPSAAASTLRNALKKVSKSDPAYSTLNQVLQQLGQSQ